MAVPELQICEYLEAVMLLMRDKLKTTWTKIIMGSHLAKHLGHFVIMVYMTFSRVNFC